MDKIKVPRVRVVNGDVFIVYDGCVYNEPAFKTMHPDLYRAFFEIGAKHAVHIDMSEVACV